MPMDDILPSVLSDGDGKGNGDHSITLAESLVKALEEGLNASHASESINGSEAAAIVKAILERFQQQEYAIQQLQVALRSQNDTLQDLMTTMKAGFAAVLASPRQQQFTGSTDSAGSIFQQNSHLRPESPKDILQRHTFVVNEGPIRKTAQASPLADDESITLQTSSFVQPLKTSDEERLTGEAVQQLQLSHDAYSSGMSTYAVENQHFCTGSSRIKCHDPKPAFGDRSRGELLDDDDDSQPSIIDHHQGQHHVGFADARRRSTSCRGKMSLEPMDMPNHDGRHPFVSRDTMPCQPTHLPSPCTNSSANRMPTRLSRATSAPTGRLDSTRIKANRSKKTGIHQMPPRLPPRWPTHDESVTDGDTKIVNVKMEKPSLEKSITANNKNASQDESSILVALEAIKMKQNVTSFCNRTNRSPRMPMRNCSISDGLDFAVIPHNGTQKNGNNPITRPTQMQKIATVAYRSSGCDLNDDEGVDIVNEDSLEEHDRSGVRTTSPTQSSSQLISGDLHDVSSSSLDAVSARPSLLSHCSSRSSVRFNQRPSTQTAAVSSTGNDPRPITRTSSRGSRRDISALHSMQHLHLSCVTLDSALVDEAQHRSGEDDDDLDDDHDNNTYEPATIQRGEVTWPPKSKPTIVVGCPPSVVLVDCTSDRAVDAGAQTREDSTEGHCLQERAQCVEISEY